MSGTGKRFIFAFHCLLNYETGNRNIKSLNSSEIKIFLFLTCPSISWKASKIRIPVSQSTHLLDFSSHFNGPFSSLLDSGFMFHWMHVYSDFGVPLLSSLAASILIVVSISMVGGGHKALLISSHQEKGWHGQSLTSQVQGPSGRSHRVAEHCEPSRGLRSPFPRPSLAASVSSPLAAGMAVSLLTSLVHLLLLLCPFMTKIHVLTFQPGI
ncbi:hypothetical protein HJG60_010838 [Phyllostomus discolor]|uniref:Uncharacterized protein n=1 Tax=Phyllostomus discolor TaxID=89673 RepID=A0A834E6F2_9CHIR|nr:hypothetical protein HJG60_010838 [Phyllostomus discolor]